MASYSFQIRKADHRDADGNYDLHVHVYKNEFRRRRLLGRYRLPSLEPIFPDESELTQGEISDLAGWLKQPEQVIKLNAFLKETLFDIHKIAKISPKFGEVLHDKGETYINIRIPLARRIKN